MNDENRTRTWDWAGRLASVTQAGETISYVYDALGRRVKRTVSGNPSTYSWYDGWQLIEETNLAGGVGFEVVNGRAVDEPLQYTEDGTTYRVLQDRMGSVTGVLSEANQLLESYEYDPYGRFRRHGQESLEQVRLESLTLVLRFTGEMGSAAASAVTLTPQPPGEWTFSEDGHELRFLPTDSETDSDSDPDWPTTGSVAINIPATARSAFGIEIESGWSGSLDMTHMVDQVVADTRPPSVDQVAQDSDGAIRVVFSEPMQSDGLAPSLILREHGRSGSVPRTVTLESDRMAARIVATEPLTAGAVYDLDLGVNLAKDLSNQTAAAATWSWTHELSSLRIWDTGTDSVPGSLFGNRLFFQGRELDPVTGLYDFRNRWYDPESGRFISRDPSGYPDGPNQYAAFGANPANRADPLGLFSAVMEVNSNDDEEESEAVVLSPVQEWIHLGLLDFSEQRRYEIAKQYAANWAELRREAIFVDPRFQRQLAGVKTILLIHSAVDAAVMGGIFIGDIALGYEPLRLLLDESESDDSGRYERYWRQRYQPVNKEDGSENTRDRRYTVPGTRSVRDQKLSDENDDLYERETIYDKYGRKLGNNDFTDHGRPDVHENPHHHVNPPDDPSGHVRPRVRPGLHPATPPRE